MKKTLLVLLLTLVMVVCFAAFTASAEETHTDHCVCGGSAVGVHDHACETLEWKAWTEGVTDISKLGSGNYYLTGDVTISAATTLTQGTTIRICLNGHNITSTSTRVVGYLAKGYISFCDCSGEQDADGQWTWDGTVTAGEGSGQYGGVMYTRYKTTVEVYGGNFTGLSTTAKNGAVFVIANDGSPDVDGNGTVSDAEKSLPENASTFNMYGGNIFATEGKSTSGSGGLVCAFHYVNMNIHGGYIHGGTVRAGNGGNISVNGNLTITGGEIYDGTSGKGYSGGSIYVSKGSCTISGGKIYNGTSGAKGGNIYLTSTTTGMTITGGTFSGGVVAAGSTGKDVYIYANSSASNNLVLNGAIDTLDYGTDKGPIVLGENFSANKITVDTTVDYGTIVKSGATVENVKCFEPADSAKHLVLVNDTIRLANPETAQKHYTCYCGGNGAYLASSVGHSCTVYSDWIDLNAHLAGLAPEAGSKVELKENNKRYYLSDDLTIDYYLAFGDATNSTTKAYKVYLDLNGHTLTGASTLTDDTFVRARSQFYLCDSSFNPNAETVEARYSGAIVATANRSYSLMYGSAGARVRVYGGKLYSTYEGTRKGCLIATSCLFAMYEGYINGGKASASGASVAVYDSGELDVFGGLIEGGETTTNGGNIYIDKVNGKLILVGGTISGGKANRGGNIYVSRGTVEIKGGTVQNGTATGADAVGGNIYVSAGISDNDDGSIKEQYYGKLKMSSGTVKDGTATYGGNIYISAATLTTTVGDVVNVYTVPGTFTFSGGTISGGNATYGGSMEIRGVMTMSGGTIDGGHSTKEGGNIRLYMTNVNDVDGKNIVVSTFTQTGGTIKNGTSDSTGGNMHAYGNVNLTGGSMENGSSVSAGGNLRLYRPAVANIGSGYTISGGATQKQGGNIAMGGSTTTSAYSDYCTVNISGTIANGIATDIGGNIYSSSDFSILTLDGVTTIGGQSGAATPDIYFTGASKLTLKGNCTINQLRLNNQNGQTVDASDLTSTTPIPIGCRKFGEFATSTADTSACFVSIQTSEIKHENGKLITTAPQTVHVSSDGDDNLLGTEALPYKTLEHALDVIGDDGTVNILDTVDGGAFEKHGKHVTINGGELVLPATRTELQDHITFKNVLLTIPYVADEEQYYIYCNGYTTVFSDDISVRYFDGTNYADNIKNSYIFGGSRLTYQNNNGNITDTDLTVLGGTWGHIYGGNNNCDLLGNAHLTVGGNVNKDLDYAVTGHDSNTNGYNRAYGGSKANSGYTANITGTVYMTVKGGKFNSVFGGSYGETSVGAIEMTIEGGAGMAAYGAGLAGAQTVGTVNMYFKDGYFEQVFGGTLSRALTGDVNMYITGGEISRRLYGGSYNTVSVEGLLQVKWSTEHAVTGNIRMYIGEGANISCKLTKHDDLGIYGHSRRGNATTSDTEDAAIIFLTKAAYEANQKKLGCQDAAMKVIMGSKPVADVICYLAWGANDETNVISSNATAVKDPKSGKTGNAAEFMETVTLTLANGPFYYNGKAHEPATVTESNWKQAAYELAYADNTAIGTATVTLTANGYTVSETFDIVKKAEVAEVNGKQYEWLQDAVNAVAENGYMKILIDCDEPITISKPIYLDLAGHKLTGKVTVAEGATLYGADSTTDDYNCADGYGQITNVTGTVAPQYKATLNGKVRRYVTYTDSETKAVSFHRIYVGVTSVSLRPGASGMGYKATVAGDEKVIEMMDGTVYMTMWVEGNEAGAQTRSAAMDGNRMTFSALVKGIDVEKHHDIKLYANVSVKLGDETLTSTSTNCTMKQAILAVAKAIDGGATYSDAQMSAIQDLCSAHSEIVSAWGEVMNHILNWTPAA